jgi:hypothetical protein
VSPTYTTLDNNSTWDLKPEIQLDFARIDFLLKLHISFDDVFVDPDRGGEKTDRPKFVPPIYLLNPGILYRTLSQGILK